MGWTQMKYWPWIMLSWVAIATTFSLSACTSPPNATGPNATEQSTTQSITASDPATDSTLSAEPTLSYEGTPPAWAETATDVMQQLEDWRGLRFKADLQVTFEPQSDPNLNGYYNSETKKLSVTTDGSEALGRGVLLHEIFHALQDQHFDLYNLHVQSLTEPDYDKAVSAIIEGEAMLAVAELMNYNFLDHARLPETGEVSEELFQNIFLYGSGLQFIQAIREEGGWAAVDEVFRDPPQATTLILNPERYLAGERTAQTLEIPLAPDEILEAQSIRGEYQVQWLFARLAQSRSQLPLLADSYLADTLGIVTTADGTTQHRWIIEFESATAAEALAENFTTALKTETDTESVSVSVEGSKIVAQW